MTQANHEPFRSHAQRPKVLVADDEPASANSIARILQNAGYVTVTALNGVEASERFAACYPDVLITDLNMPLMSGVELCRFVKNVSNVPVIMISGREELELRLVSSQVGADDYLTKPIDPRLLILKVSSLITGGEKN